MANRKFGCEICKIYTGDQTSLDNHLLGSKHQLALHTKIVKDKKEKCGIYITGISSTATKEDIIDLFSKYGKIVDFYAGPENRFVIIQFEKEKIAQEVLKKRINFHGCNLLIRPRVVNKLFNPVAAQHSKQDLEYTKILNCIKHQPNFDAQLINLINMLQMFDNVHNPSSYNRICADLEHCLRTRFPYCRVWPFGSTVSGLAFKNSDIDIYVDVVRPLDVSSSSDSPAAACTRIARNVLGKMGQFTNIIAIPKAKIPIVTLIHKDTKINCDINFKNMLGVCNSNLIKFLLSLDSRLRPFIIVIKFWGQIQEVSGSGKISSYGLIMLVIFYLQQYPNPVLPPIEVFQTSDSYKIIEGWNGGFLSDPNLFPRECTHNFLHISALLFGFFQFWSKFDYGFNIICPLTGKVQLKSDFSKPENLPHSFWRYKMNIKNCEPLKTNTALCLQDPFELCHNVTANISSKQLEDFQKNCEISVDIFRSSNNKLILPKLFTKQQLDKTVVATDNYCSFKISGTTLSISDVNETKSDDPNYLRQLWFEKVNQFVISVLSKLFLFEITVKKDVQQKKSQKLDGQSDIHDTTIIDTLTFHCVGYNNVWEARKSISKNLGLVQDNSKDFLQHEIGISEYIVNVLCKGLKVTTPIVDFNLTLNSKINPTEAEFVLIDVNSKKNSFKVMARFFSSKLRGWFDRYLRELQNKNKKDSDDKLETNESNQQKTNENNQIKTEDKQIENKTIETVVIDD